MKKAYGAMLVAAGSVAMVGCIGGSSAAWPAVIGNSLFGMLGSFVIDAVIGGLFPAAT